MNLVSVGRRVLISAAAGACLWALFSWPLPLYFSRGIPAAAHPWSADVQEMTAGDHLQFLYHCWLFGDMLAGRTPFFYNLYEFNTGDDEERFHPDPYYVPFSMVYALGSAAGGRAFGWNLTGLISIWLTFLASWLLARRYASGETIAALCAAVAAALPYRWVSLLGGSPTGLAMMWVPIAWLGVDMAAREDKIAGGFLAGCAILFASWTDLHVCFFSVLALPAWCVLALLGRRQWEGPRRRVIGGLFRALLPIAVFAVLAALFPGFMKWIETLKTGLAPAADLVGKRSMSEVLLCSPGWQGFFGAATAGRWSEIYIGFALPAIIAAGMAAAACRAWTGQREHARVLLILFLLALGMAAISALALGARGPFDAILLRACRKLIPPYGMIRQPAKIFCLVPSFVSVSLAAALSALVGPVSRKALKLAIPALCVAAVLAEYSPRINPHICLLDKRQGAYEAVAAASAAKGKPARAMVVPLWPGDSHYSSVYQYDVSLYRIRMINGYTPFVKRAYFENVFRRFESVNIGELSDAQLDELLAMGVDAVIVHEDLFPEKVSPFAVGFTLRQLLNHPRLALLKQDGPVWAFEILPGPAARPDAARWDMFGSARNWSANSCSIENAEVMPDAASGNGGFVRFSVAGSRLSTPGEDLGSAPDMKWMVRARGDGALFARAAGKDSAGERMTLPVRSPEWIWLDIPVGNRTGFSSAWLELERQSGVVDIDIILLAAGRWTLSAGEGGLRIPATAFFHAGFIDRERDSVVLQKFEHANVCIFYGPKLPLEKGLYEVEIEFRTDAEPGTPLGWFNIRRRHDEPETRNAVVAGLPAIASLNQTENLPVSVEFVFLRNADMKIDAVSLRKSEETQPRHPNLN